MHTAVKIGLLIVGSLVTYKAARAISAAMVAMGMSVKINPETKVDMKGVELTTNIDISNPTDSSMVLTSPFVQLFHKDQQLANNKVSNTEFKIEPLTETRIPIVLKLTWQQILELIETIQIKFPSSYTNLQKILWLYDHYKEVLNQLGLVAKYSTYANGIHYTDSQTIKI